MVGPQVTIGFNTKSWSNDSDDLGYPHDLGNLHIICVSPKKNGWETRETPDPFVVLWSTKHGPGTSAATPHRPHRNLALPKSSGIPARDGFEVTKTGTQEPKKPQTPGLGLLS